MPRRNGLRILVAKMSILLRGEREIESSVVVISLLFFAIVKKTMTGSGQQIIVALELMTIALACICHSSKGTKLTLPPKNLMIWFGLFMFCGLFSAIVNTNLNKYSLLQAALNVKILLVIFYITNRKRNALFSSRVIVALLLLNLLFIGLEFLAVDTYSRIFPATTTGSVVPGTSIKRASGIFNHPGQLALFAFAIFVSSLFCNNLKNRGIILAMSSLLIIFAMQRPELAFTIVSISIFIFFKFHSKSKISISIFLLSIGLVLAPIVGPAATELFVLNMSVFFDTSVPFTLMAPRTVLLIESIELAGTFFPLGTGFGTYGSGQSISNPHSVYKLTDLLGIWWFDNGMYYFDFFWGSVIAETGVLGFFSLSLFIYRLLGYLRRKNPYYTHEKKFTKFNCILVLLCLYFVINSLGTPMINGSILNLLLITYLIRNLQVVK